MSSENKNARRNERNVAAVTAVIAHGHAARTVTAATAAAARNDTGGAGARVDTAGAGAGIGTGTGGGLFTSQLRLFVVNRCLV